MTEGKLKKERRKEGKHKKEGRKEGRSRKEGKTYRRHRCIQWTGGFIALEKEAAKC
jgi:hypothetical protein